MSCVSILYPVPCIPDLLNFSVSCPIVSLVFYVLCPMFLSCILCPVSLVFYVLCPVSLSCILCSVSLICPYLMFLCCLYPESLCPMSLLPSMPLVPFYVSQCPIPLGYEAVGFQS